MEERLVSFSLFGQDFSFFSDAPENEVQDAIKLLCEELEGGAGLVTGSTVPSSKVLVLGCLRLAARYVNLQKDSKTYREGMKQTIDKLIDKISSGIE